MKTKTTKTTKTKAAAIKATPDARLVALVSELETGTKTELARDTLTKKQTKIILGIAEKILAACPDLPLTEIPELVSNLGEDFSGVAELTLHPWTDDSAILADLAQYRPSTELDPTPGPEAGLTVLAPGGLPTSEFQSNIRTAVHPGEATAPAVAAPAAKKAKADKRKVLNPQPVLDAKTEALKSKGVKLTWAGRAWHAGGKTFSSKEMAGYTVDEFSALFPART